MAADWVRRLAVVSVLALEACGTGAVTGAAQPRIRGSISGREGQVDFWYSVAADCSSSGYPDLRIVTAPSHGTLRIAKGENFPDFPKDNVRQACNTKKLPVVFVYYQSDRGFTGTDTAVVEILFPSGNLRTISYAISVRP